MIIRLLEFYPVFFSGTVYPSPFFGGLSRHLIAPVLFSFSMSLEKRKGGRVVSRSHGSHIFVRLSMSRRVLVISIGWRRGPSRIFSIFGNRLQGVTLSWVTGYPCLGYRGYTVTEEFRTHLILTCISTTLPINWFSLGRGLFFPCVFMF